MRRLRKASDRCTWMSIISIGSCWTSLLRTKLVMLCIIHYSRSTADTRTQYVHSDFSIALLISCSLFLSTFYNRTIQISQLHGYRHCCYWHISWWCIFSSMNRIISCQTHCNIHMESNTGQLGVSGSLVQNLMRPWEWEIKSITLKIFLDNTIVSSSVLQWIFGSW